MLDLRRRSISSSVRGDQSANVPQKRPKEVGRSGDKGDCCAPYLPRSPAATSPVRSRRDAHRLALKSKSKLHSQPVPQSTETSNATDRCRVFAIAFAAVQFANETIETSNRTRRLRPPLHDYHTTPRVMSRENTFGSIYSTTAVSTPVSRHVLLEAHPL